MLHKLLDWVPARSFLVAALLFGSLPTVTAAQSGWSEVVLRNFANPPSGPVGTLIRDTAGNLYGATSAGGASGNGVVYKVDPNGNETTLYNFTGGADGGQPAAGLTADASANLYGTTQKGGTENVGVVYKLNASGETVLYSFSGGSDGGQPESSLILDAEGNLYGTTYAGGSAGLGVVFEISPNGQETVLYSFQGGSDGAHPQAAVIRDSEGNLYGATLQGGTANAGVVFKIGATGETVLYSFTGGPDGSGPSCGLLRDAQGNLYGCTSAGGTSGAGVVYQVNQANRETVLYSFTGGSDGGAPNSLVGDGAGNLFGTATKGGYGQGVIFEINSGGEQVLWNFTMASSFSPGGNAGYGPNGLIRDSSGNLYGTTRGGSVVYNSQTSGSVFKFQTGSGASALYSFGVNQYGYRPSGGVIGDLSGNLYGVTMYGGLLGAGLVYKLNARGETVLHSFNPNFYYGPNREGAFFPQWSPISDSSGNLFGVANAVYGPDLTGMVSTNSGIVYKIDATGDFTEFYKFPQYDYPESGVILDNEGNLYGVSTLLTGSGGVYKINPSGQRTVLYSFPGGTPGGPFGGLVRDGAGNLYGVTTNGDAAYPGTVYKINAAGQGTDLYAFTGGLDGGEPLGPLFMDAVGNLYGVTQSGGSANAGVVFKINTTGGETVLYAFKGGTDGSNPAGGVIGDASGNLYGTTLSGGTAGLGVVFRLNRSGETVLHSFTGGLAGGSPNAGLILDPTGNLYGTTTQGGSALGGLVFQLKKP